MKFPSLLEVAAFICLMAALVASFINPPALILVFVILIGWVVAKAIQHEMTL
jgi:hypothetical protein